MRLTERDGVDWKRVQEEAVLLLRHLIRFDTTNPPGNELPAARWLAGLLQQEGIEPQILESRPGRANLIARLPGKGSAEPLLLFSHLDVVPAEAEAWSHHPFSADLADGCIWGRGAVDMKSATIMQLMAILLMRRLNVVPQRDIILAAVADEEVGGDLGAAWLVQNHPDVIRAEFALNELGGFNIHVAGRRIYPIGVAEKGVCLLRLRATGQSGHGSMSLRGNAITHLGHALSLLGQRDLPQHVIPVVRDSIHGIARVLPFPRSLVFRRILNLRLGPRIAAAAFKDDRTGRGVTAMLRNVATPTVVRAGEAFNVIPRTAEAVVDGRLLPGQQPQDLVREIQDIIGPSFEIEVVRADPMPPVSPYNGGFYSRMAETLRGLDPEATVIPYLMPAVSDSRHLAKLGIRPYGFTPMRVPPGFSVAQMPHGLDERIPVDSLAFGLRAMYHLLRQM